jgi:hypothetical protein
MKKPTGSSVTSRGCTCGMLQRYAANKLVPIGFDQELNEYYLECAHENGVDKVMVYHCPFCGGCAPASKRGTKFQEIPTLERFRLRMLVRGIASVTEAKSKLGQPDDEFPAEAFLKIRELFPEFRSDALRMLRYTKLSASANVCIIEKKDGTISIAFGPKPKT